MKQTLQEVARHGVLSDIFGDRIDGPLGQAGLTYKNARRLSAEMADAAAAAQRDAHLTAAGQAAVVRKAVKQALAELEAVTAPLANARAARDRLRRELSTTTPAGTNDVVRELQRQEVRAVLRGQDPLLNGATLMTAVERGDAITIEAILGAPGFFGLVSEDQAAAARQAWAERQDPIGVAELRRLERGVTEAERAVEAARRDIRRAGDLDDDPLEVVAGGGPKDDAADDPVAAAARGEAS